MPDRHRSNPVTFRPPAADRARLQEAARLSGRPAGAILAEALRLWLDLSEGGGQLVHEGQLIVLDDLQEARTAAADAQAMAAAARVARLSEELLARLADR